MLAPSVTILTPGQNRFGFALFDAGQRQIGELEAALYISRGVDETAHGPFPAKYEPIDVKPQFESRTTAQDPDAAQSVYVSRIRFSRPGSYLVTATGEQRNKPLSDVTCAAGNADGRHFNESLEYAVPFDKLKRPPRPAGRDMLPHVLWTRWSSAR